jgi:hypothetical protein
MIQATFKIAYNIKQNKLSSKETTIKTIYNQNNSQSKQLTIKTTHNQNNLQSKQLTTIKTN